MKKLTIVECFMMVLACSAAFALTVDPANQWNYTVTNTSVSTPLTTDTDMTTSGYTIVAGENNTGTIYIGSSSVNSTNYAINLNPNDSISESNSDTYYRMSRLYYRGSAINDTFHVKYNNP